MKLHTFFLSIDGERTQLPDCIDSVALAQEQAERQAVRTGKSVFFYSQTLLGLVKGESKAAREAAVAAQE